MVTGSGGEDKYKSAKNAKELLDMIGKDVHEIVEKDEAKKYIDELKGNLQKAKGIGELAAFPDTCKRVEQYRSKANGDGKRYPCTELSEKYVERFSNTLGGQCTDSKMRRDGIGACAPYRRLHLCHHNLENIKDVNNIDNDTLLAEVCMAAYYEGESLTRYNPIYQTKYKDSGSTMCTELARSFADIGDIVRGRDLFRGNDEEKKKRDELEKNLKTIFGKIHSRLTKDAQNYYEDNDTDKNYYQLREDWWKVNRDQVWEAITCEAKSDDKYNVIGPDGKITESNKGQCRCFSGDPPTNMDYVPQFLRWFEEWAEDFCRLRKHKLKDAIDKCRTPKGKEKYCDLNRYDCEQTIRGDHDFVEDDVCKGCQYSCSHFVNWIDNQKLEFDKQKRKYKSEIKKYKSEITGGAGGKGKTRKRRSASNENYEGYEKKFYDKFKSRYKEVGEFLGLLNNETTCTKKLNDQGEEEGTINFKNVHSGKHSSGGDGNKTFYRTKYCEACPWCGAQKVEGGWKDKNKDCAKKKERIFDEHNTTTIEILTADKKQLDILKKYSKFCDSVNGTANVEKDKKRVSNGATGKKGNQIVTWQCYFDKEKPSKKNNNCVEGEWKDFEEGKSVKSYNGFFWKWVHDMLIDSMQWRDEHGNCINKDNDNTCRNNKKCNKECGCFQKWVEQKKKEWQNIKKHFDKQTDIVIEGGPLGELSHCGVLEWNLKEEFLKDESTEDKENKVSAEEAKEIKHLKKMLQQAGVDVGDLAAFVGPCTKGPVAGQNTTIDKLLNQEDKDAKDCQSKHNDCPQPPAEEVGVARADTPTQATGGPRPATTKNTEDDDAEEDEEDEEEEEEEEEKENADAGGEDGKEEKSEEKEEDPPAAVEDTAVKRPQQETQPEEAPTATDPSLNVCTTVDKALTDQTNLTKACQQKYEKGREKFPNWKCIPSGDNSTTREGSESGLRRSRRDADSQTPGEKTTPPSGTNQGAICVPPRRRKLYIQKLPDVEFDDKSLRKWFIETAAIETFFLWDRYKKIKAKEKKEKEDAKGQIYESAGEDDEDKDPQEELQRGDIPDGFLRQMFYTLGDYRDILEGKNDILIGKTGTGSAKDEMADKENKIKEAIKKFFQNGDSQLPSGKPGDERKKFWEANEKHIWNAMVCALTYEEKTSSASGGEKNTTITQDDGLKGALIKDGNPKNPQYHYEKVTLENSGPSPKLQTGSPGTSGDNTPLTQFVKIPTFFRWLHEWGSDFCGTRKRMLDKIIFECRGNGKVCSGDGEDCKDQLKHNPSTVRDFLCPTCGRHCSFYKKWIDIKKKEFEEQSNAYTGQKDKCKKDSNNGFYRKLQTYNEAKDFLQTLRPCKTNNENNNGDDKLDFTNPKETFRPAKNCKPCSEFKVKCDYDNCTGANANTCTTRKISPKDIDEKTDPNGNIEMLVSDDSATGFAGDLNDDCKNAHIFKAFREDVWTCGKVCGYNVCKPVKVNGETFDAKKKGENQIIIIRALFKIWLEYFLEDYNKIKKKLNPCRNNGEVSKCINDYDEKHKCVEQWIEKKRAEWEKIKKHYKRQNEKGDTEMISLVRNFLGDVQPQTEVHKAIQPCKDLDKFQDSSYCTVNGSSAKGKDGTQKDIVECLFQKLEEKAKTCSTSTSEETQNTAQCQDTHPDDDLSLEETEEVKAPNICPKDPESKKDEPDDCCEQAKALPKETADVVADNGSGNDEVQEEEESEEKNKGDAAPLPEKPSVIIPAIY
ncbi:hypothetical protein PFNF54_00151 [Plasmodium falciparum NF54]|uniref:Erythrocyte membrane protein 1 n=1 Tax=Plasmodium falciparum (isolate NF54) TaxID=5843 RepID=W7KNA7_PLAFO|nr:hypothetical protein PFNF54_00151 [Plasmodium falciparum NF54]